MNFKGFDDYIEIFKGGKQIDSTGHEHDGDSLIDTAISKFNAAIHEPPLTIGHPSDNKPAWGWVESLKKEGNSLFAKFRSVVPEFEDMVKKEMFKKRSAAFYPDGGLRHVAFLGAAPPAVKGLADLNFADNEMICFEEQLTKKENIMPDPVVTEDTEQKPKGGGDEMMKRLSDCEAAIAELVKSLTEIVKRLDEKNPPKEETPKEDKKTGDEATTEIKEKAFSEADINAKIADAMKAGREAAETSQWLKEVSMKLPPAKIAGLEEVMESIGKFTFSESNIPKEFIKNLVNRFADDDAYKALFSEFAKDGHAAQSKASDIGNDIAARANKSVGTKGVK